MHPDYKINANSYIGGDSTNNLQMASHLEHLAAVLRQQALQHMTRGEQLSYVQVALASHSQAIVEVS